VCANARQLAAASTHQQPVGRAAVGSAALQRQRQQQPVVGARRADACGAVDAARALQRLRGGAEAASTGGLMGWLRMLRALLFPGNPLRTRAPLPTPELKAKKPAASAGATKPASAKARRTMRAAGGKGGGVQSIHSKAEFDKMLAGVRGKQLVVVDFFATWCGPCKQIAPKYEAMAKELPHVKFVKVDVDQAKDVSQQYKVSSMPTFKMLKQGKEVGSLSGADEGALREKVESLAGKPDRWASAGASRAL